MARWDIDKAAACYGIDRWGKDIFSINEAGHVQIHVNGRQLDLKQLLDDLRARDLHPPVLLRFSDILKSRMRRFTPHVEDRIRRGIKVRETTACYPKGVARFALNGMDWQGHAKTDAG